jgi:hypothetical protein
MFQASTRTFCTVGLAHPALRHAISVLLIHTALLGSALAACPSVPGRFTGSGAEVTDTQTGLIWARCSANQTTSGADCSGDAGTYTHEQALAYATSQAGWRLPNMKELASLTDRGCQSPTIDATAFPATPSSIYWSSSANTGDPKSAWGVFFGYGYVNFYVRSTSNAVRLVRASP